MPWQLTHSTCQPPYPVNCTIPVQHGPSGISSLIEKFEGTVSDGKANSTHKDVFTAPSKTHYKRLTQPSSSISHQRTVWHGGCINEAQEVFPRFISRSAVKDSKLVTNAENKMSTNKRAIKEKIRFFEGCETNSVAYCKFHLLPRNFTNIFLPLQCNRQQYQPHLDIRTNKFIFSEDTHQPSP